MSQEVQARDLNDDGELSHREILLGMSGPMLGMFVALLSGAIVTNALPRIIPDLGGSQTGYTWVVVATFLTLTAFNPVWGKLADLVNLQTLVQVALGLWVLGNLTAGLAQSLPMLIAARGVIGLGMGGMSTLGQAVIARLAPPRQRGKYAGYSSISYALGTVCGPLVGGLIADSPLGWRGCFFVPVPLALFAFVMMQRTLKIHHVPRKVQIDYAGGTLLTLGISLLLVLLSLGGSSFDWISTQSVLLGIGAVVGIGGALLVEAHVAEPIIQLALFRKRTVTLSVVCAALIGVAPYSATVYLSEGYQYAHGLNPTQSGLLTIPMILGITGTGIVSGRIVSHAGKWKPVAMVGLVILMAGMALIGSTGGGTPFWVVAAFSAVLGIGMGATSQNFILAVQNVVDDTVVGSATSLILFAQSLGGTVGMTILGTVLNHTVSSKMPELDGSLPKPSMLPESIRDRYQDVMGDGIGHLFMLMVPSAILALVLCALIAGARMRVHRQLDEAAGEAAAEGAA